MTQEQPDDFRESLRKTLLLKQFAVRNGYKVPAGILSQISALELQEIPTGNSTGNSNPGPRQNANKEGTKELAGASAKLDGALIALTSITFPITADSLAEGDPEDYNEFKRRLLYIGLIALGFAMTGLVGAIRVTQTKWINQVGASVLAISLGLLGAVVYSFFNVLGVTPAQTFDRKDEYALYARLELGVLLGWVFYFGFARSQYEHLADIREKSQAFYLMIPFIAGYSTKFVVGVLERIMVALLVALGIEGKREVGIKRTRNVAPDAPAS